MDKRKTSRYEYPIRCATSWLSAIGVFCYLFVHYSMLKKLLPEVWNWIYLLSNLERFRWFFHAGIGVSVIIFLFAWSSDLFDKKFDQRVRMILIVFVAFTASAIPVLATWNFIPPANRIPYFSLLPLLFLNTLSLHYQRRSWHDPVNPLSKWLKRLFPIADILAPLAIWTIYHAKGERRTKLSLLIAILLTNVLIFGPWIYLTALENTLKSIATSPLVKKISPAFGYQILVDEADGNVIMCDDSPYITKIYVSSGLVRRTSLSPLNHQIQAVGFDSEKREMIFSDPWGGHTFVLDSSKMEIKSVIRIENREEQTEVFKDKHNELVRTDYDVRSGILTAFNMDQGVALLNREGNRILLPEMLHRAESLRGKTVDSIIDADRRIVHWITWNKYLNGTGVDSLKLERSRPLPSLPERLALDKKRSRLFITFPNTGKVLIVDPATYGTIASIDSFPGVRAITLDEQDGRFYLGGFPPVLEVRSLENYSLLDRIVVQPYTRWIAVDRPRKVIYLSAYANGLYRYDVGALGTDPVAGFFRRIDPFYPALGLSIRAIRSITRLIPHRQAVMMLD